MKHLTTILAAVLCAVCLSGCKKDEAYGVKIDEHAYVVIKTDCGVGIIHDPDCPCHKKGGEE